MLYPADSWPILNPPYLYVPLAIVTDFPSAASPFSSPRPLPPFPSTYRTATPPKDGPNCRTPELLIHHQGPGLDPTSTARANEDAE